MLEKKNAFIIPVLVFISIVPLVSFLRVLYFFGRSCRIIHGLVFSSETLSERGVGVYLPIK